MSCDITSGHHRVMNYIIVSPVKLSTYGPRAFAVAGPTTRDILPECLHDHTEKAWL